MRRYTIAINESSFEIDVEELAADTFRVQLEGRTLDVRLADDQDLAQALITPALEVGTPPGGTPAPPAAGAAPATGPASAAPVARTAPAGGRRPRRAGALTAPMPGVVLSVQVSPGQQVAKGDPLLVLEAMKMENTLRAPADGRVAEVLVAASDQVKYGDPLVRFGES